MIATLGCAWVASLALAAGAVIDVGGSAEARGSFFGDSEAGTLGLYGLVARPFVQGALESERVAAEASYQPQVSLLVPTESLLSLLHTGSAGVELVLSRRLQLRARAFGSIGDLDRGAAQRELFSSVGVLDPSQAFTYAAGGAELGLAARLTRITTLDVSASVRGIGSPGFARVESGALRTSHSEQLDSRSTLQVTRRDAALLDAGLRVNTIVDGGARGDMRAIGVLGAGGARHALSRGAAVEIRAGGLASVADLADGRGRKLVLLPLLDGRIGATLDLGGGAAFFGDGAFGVTPVSDPLGALLESRALLQLTAGARFTRDTALRGSVFAGAPLFSYGSAPTATTATGASVGFSWAFVDDASFDIGALSQSRLLPREPAKPRVLAVDLSVSCGVSGTFNVFHSGSRPRGSDPRPTRSVTEQQVGRARPPQQEALPAEPPPLPEEPEPEALPLELVPPPVQPPLEIETTEPGKKKRPTPAAPKPLNPDDDDELVPDRGAPRTDPTATDSSDPATEVSSEKKP